MLSNFSSLFKVKDIELSSEKSINFLGKGSYGCVIKPGIKKDNKIDEDTETITKLFYDKDAYLKEIEEDKIIKSFDSENKFTVKLKVYSKLNNQLPIINKSVLHNKCKELFEKKDQDVYQIEYEYGGVDLEALFQQKNKEILKKINLHNFFKSFANILYGINEMKKNGYSHFDIKIDNIVFNPKTYKFCLIDFGLLQKTENIYHTSIICHDYHLRPPEYLIVSYMFIKKHIEKNVFQSVINSFQIFERANSINNANIKALFHKYLFDIYLNKIIETDEVYNKLLDMFKNINKVHSDKLLSKFKKNNYIDKNINEACHLIEIETDNIKQKYDIYMLGIALLYIIIEMFRSNDTDIKSIDETTIEKILILILKMIEPNPCLRITTEEAYKEYIAIFSH